MSRKRNDLSMSSEYLSSATPRVMRRTDLSARMPGVEVSERPPNQGGLMGDLQTDHMASN
jgi:hypothetical protein